MIVRRSAETELRLVEVVSLVTDLTDGGLTRRKVAPRFGLADVSWRLLPLPVTQPNTTSAAAVASPSYRDSEGDVASLQYS